MENKIIETYTEEFGKRRVLKMTLKGYDDITGLFKSRYYAKKYAKGDEKVVKVEGGYTVMSAEYYYGIWKSQK